MRKIDVIANEKYQGNVLLALESMFKEEISLENYIDELSKEEAQYLFGLVSNKVNNRFGGKENVENMILRDVKLKSLNLTEEEVRNAKKNPYKAEMSKGFLKLLLAEGGIVAIALAGNSMGVNAQTLGVIGSALTALMSYGFADNIIKYFKFKNIKKELENETLKNDIDDITRGRSL